jgi:DNA topoisomerase-1
MSGINAMPNSQSPERSAEIVGLRYVTDDRPGIRRERNGRGFSYRNVDGKVVRDLETIERIKFLVIPPAWTDVWICPIENGHLQATGRDDRGRKQFLYHQRWREIRDQTKYERMMDFARALPKIRRRIRRDLRLRGLCREKVLATVVRLLERSLIRVGNDEYAKENNSYGLTTMKDHHAKIEGSKIKFHFRGKSGKEHTVEVEDRRLAKIVRACQELPGQELFQWVDDEGKRHDVGSGDVNDYLHEISGQDFTAKDFRTWAGTVCAANELQRLGSTIVNGEAKKLVSAAIKVTAQYLGNTPTVCRKSYVHPAVIEAFLSGSLLSQLSQPDGKAKLQRLNLPSDEAAVFRFLKCVVAQPSRLRVQAPSRSVKKLAA